MIATNNHATSATMKANASGVSNRPSTPESPKIGKNTSIVLSGDLTLTSTDNSSGSQAIVDAGASVAVAGDAEITSGNKASINGNATVTVSQNLNMEAGTCSISGSAKVTAGSKSGNCL